MIIVKCILIRNSSHPDVNVIIINNYYSIYSGGVGAVVRSLPSNPKVPGSIPGSAETGIFSDLLSR